MWPTSGRPPAHGVPPARAVLWAVEKVGWWGLAGVIGVNVWGLVGVRRRSALRERPQVTLYSDCLSPFSYMAFSVLRRY